MTNDDAYELITAVAAGDPDDVKTIAEKIHHDVEPRPKSIGADTGR